MSRFATSSIFARLRGSARLAVLALLVFCLNVGAAVACATHDVAALGQAEGIEAVVVVDASIDLSDQSAVAKRLLSHTSNCAHCTCHHAAPLLPPCLQWVVSIGHGLQPTMVAASPSDTTQLSLRPPIA